MIRDGAEWCEDHIEPQPCPFHGDEYRLHVYATRQMVHEWQTCEWCKVYG